MWLRLIETGATTFVALFPILNPPGAAAVFFALTAGDGAAYKRLQARQTAVYTLGILIVSLLLGRLILHYFGISLGALQIAGGAVVGHTGWQMLNNDEGLTGPEQSEAQDRKEIALIPMALPLLAGPGAIGVLIALSAGFTSPADFLGAAIGCALLAILIYAALVVGEPVVKLLGQAGLGAVSRLLGFFILAISVDLIAIGVMALRR
jgi:multiple antibiotic resistance protein